MREQKEACVSLNWRISVQYPIDVAMQLDESNNTITGRLLTTRFNTGFDTRRLFVDRFISAGARIHDTENVCTFGGTALLNSLNQTMAIKKSGV